jgi:feruloyl-CoA synthase
MKLTGMLRASADRNPHGEALVAGQRRWTYRQLVSSCERAARVLADRGVGEGDVVAAMTYNEPEFVIGAFGAWMLGAVYVPVNHKLAVPEVEYTVEHAQARLGLVSAELAATATEAAPSVDWLVTQARDATSFAALVATAEPWEEVHTDDSAAAQVLYTSGTTSAPKGCIHSHDSQSRLSALIALNLGYESDERMLIAMPIWHSAPLNICMLPTVLMGGTVILQPEYDPIATMELIGWENATAFFGPTVAYLAPFRACRATGKDFADFDFRTMRRWLFGGSPIDAARTRQIVESYRPGGHIQVFGMTETGPSGTLLSSDEQLKKPGSIGNSGMIGVRMRVVTADGTDAAAGESGEIWFRTDTNMLGYLHDPDATTAAFDGDWYKTGDIATVDDDGYYYIVDRLADVIIVGGENVHSLEVEEAVAAHPRVADVAVVGKPDPEWGQQIVAYVTTDDAEPMTVEELSEYLESRIAKYKIPRVLIESQQLPRNPSGKVLKHQLRAQAAQE